MEAQTKAQCLVRLFAVFKKKSAVTRFAEMTVKAGSEGLITKLACLEPANGLPPGMAAQNVLHPQAGSFFTHLTTFYRLAQPLRDELSKTVWKVKIPAWAVETVGESPGKVEAGFFAFKITSINALLFPTGIFTIYLDLEPDIELNNQTAPVAGKLLLSTLSRTGNVFQGGTFKSAPISRVFPNEMQRESVCRRMQGNTEIGLIKGLCGEQVHLPEIVSDLLRLPQDYEFLMGDRFLSNTLVQTIWNGEGATYSLQEYVDLVRLSRNESDHYLPDTAQCLPGSYGIIKTFENVALAVSSEGMACWIKPTASQDFLITQFRNRFDGIYLQLYLLALHQRYALVDIAKSLDGAAPALSDMRGLIEGGDLKEIETKASGLRNIRADIADFYLRAYFQQPATLTNHQEIYQALQNAMGASDLLQEVRHATLELEVIIKSLGDLKLEAEQRRKEDNHFVLAVIAELVAIPYYSFNYLLHAWHQPQWISAAFSALLTAVAVYFTSRGFYRYRVHDRIRKLFKPPAIKEKVS